VATKQHNQMTGADLHPNKIDATTGTELTLPSQTTYDGRYARTTGATITPAANGATTVQVTKQDGTTSVFDVDTTNARVGITTSAPGYTLSLGQGLANTKLALYDDGGGQPYGLGVQGNQLRIHLGSSTARFSFLDAIAGTEIFTIKGTSGVGIGASSPSSALQVVGPIATAINTSAKTGAYTITATDSTIQADASGGAFQVTLPTAASIAGRQYTIKRINATNNVTVGCSGAETIDGATTKTLGSQWATGTVQSNGTTWLLVSQVGTVS